MPRLRLVVTAFAPNSSLCSIELRRILTPNFAGEATA
jgi:hypothetical protein